jgi:large subunit ribosomal protein L5
MSDEKVKKEAAGEAVTEEKVTKTRTTKKASTEEKPAKEKAPKAAAAEKTAKKEASEDKPSRKIGKGEKYTPRLRKLYDTEVVKSLKETFKYTTPMAIPRLVKIILNVGAGDAVQDKAVIDPIVDEMTLVSGQKAVKTYAKKSISNFHLREGMPIGARVTLRGSRMFDFLDKLNAIALPRVRDFKGLKRDSFDGRGNYSFAIREQLVFPEIDYDKVKKIRGMDITIVTTAQSDDEGYHLLRSLGFPIREK